MMKRRMLIVTMMGVLGLAGIGEAATVQLTVNPNAEADWAGDRLYRAPGSCTAPGTFTIVVTAQPTTGGAPVLFDDLNVPDGIVCYQATAFDVAGNESLPSNRVEVTVDASPPAPPTGLQLSVAEPAAGD